MYSSPWIMDNASCFGCYGYGIYGGTSYTFPTQYHYAPGTYGYGTPMIPGTPAVEDKKIEKMKTILPMSADRAEVVVRLPSDAKLFANGQLTTLASAERQFSSPKLEKGLDYEYNLKVEYTRDGKMISDSQIVRVRAGEKFMAEFKDKAPATQVLSTIKFVAPEGARVYVEKEANALQAGAKEFKTPPLSKGVEYAYNFRAEITKNGKNLTQNQRVVFKGGDVVTVDFMDIDGPRTASK
ncbi:MAG: TIGR03000 domain-containing protein [Planctomycetes bacterium]|nr:TIGR03000 domain-containing protein [Planctomycetota bacterium]